MFPFKGLMTLAVTTPLLWISDPLPLSIYTHCLPHTAHSHFIPLQDLAHTLVHRKIACNHSTTEAEGDLQQVQSQPGYTPGQPSYTVKPCLKKTNQKNF